MTETIARGETVYERPSDMVDAFVRIFHDHSEYFEIVKPLIRLHTTEDSYQWTYGEDFGFEDVSTRGFDDDLEKVSFNPDGLPYSKGGRYVTTYTENAYRDQHIAVRTESPKKGVDVSEKQTTVERMVIRRE